MKRLLITNILLFTFLVSITAPSYASWLEQNWNAMVSTSTNSPDMIQKQGSGAYFGGSFTYGTGGTTVSRVFPVDIKMPSISAGCGGIDIVNGAFDYNLDELINFLKGLISAAPGYAFQLAMQILCPSCTDILNTMNEITAMINGLQMDSCAVMQGLTDMAANAANKAIDSDLSAGKAFSYRDSMKEFNSDMKEGFNKFFGKVKDKMGCASDPKKCKSIDFLDGSRSFLQSVFESIENDSNDASIKKYFGTDYQQLFRALIGDIKFVKSESSTQNDPKDNPQNGFDLKLQPIEPMYSGSERDILNILISGNTAVFPVKGDNNNYIKTAAIDVMILGTDKVTAGNNYVRRVTFDTFIAIAFDAIDQAKQKYQILDRSQTLSPQELSFFSTLKTPVLRTLNVLFINDEMPKVFLEELKPLAGVQLSYEIVSIVAKNIQLTMNQYKEEMTAAGLYNNEIGEAIANIRQNMAKLQNIAYEQYIAQYVAFEDRIKSIGKDSIFNNMQNTRSAFLARHPVAGKALFAGGIAK